MPPLGILYVLATALVNSPAFYRSIARAARFAAFRLHRSQHPPDDAHGGTAIEEPARRGFARHFRDEVRAQLGRPPPREGQGEGAKRDDAVPGEGENAEAAWRRLSARADGEGSGQDWGKKRG